jgi:hypothetical protein
MDVTKRNEMRIARGKPAAQDTAMLAGAAVGAAGLLWLGWKVGKIALRVSGPVSTALTVAGVAMWLREQWLEREAARETTQR